MAGGLLVRMIAWFLLSLRVGGAFLWGPFWGSGFFPVRIRVLISIMVSATLAVSMPLPANLPLGAGQEFLLLLLGIKELLLGSAMGLMASFIIAAVKTAGRLISMQIGQAVANILDPASQVQVSLMGNVLALLAMVVLLSVNGHHQIILGVHASLKVLPLDHLFPVWELAGDLLRGASLIFVASLQIAAPVVIAVLLVIVGLGVLARTVPQMNIFIVGFLVTMTVGMGVIGLSIPGIVVFFITHFENLSEQMLVLLR